MPEKKCSSAPAPVRRKDRLDVFVLGSNLISIGMDIPLYQYTRAGNLTLNSAGYLTTQSGQYIVGASAPPR